MRQRPGWVFIDILMSLILIGLLATMLAAGANWHHRALTHLAESRAAFRLAESALISLQAAQPIDSSKFTCRQLSPSPDLPAMTWVQVTATVNGRSATLTGLVPKTNLPTGGGS